MNVGFVIDFSDIAEVLPGFGAAM